MAALIITITKMAKTITTTSTRCMLIQNKMKMEEQDWNLGRCLARMVRRLLAMSGLREGTCSADE